MYTCSILTRFVCFISIFSYLTAQVNPPVQQLNLFFTGDVQGTFEPCGCAGGPTGGVSRRVGFSERYHEENEGLMLQVDTGNYFAAPGRNAKPINTYLKESLDRIPLKVMNLGVEDLYWWNEISHISNSPTEFISTNLVPRRSNLATPKRYAIVEYPGKESQTVDPIKIGFLGLVDPQLVKPNSGFRAIDPLEAVRNVKSDLKNCDFWIVLWDLMRPQRGLEGSVIEALAEEHEEIYSIITTEKRFVLYEPVQINSAVILSSVERGRYLGRLTFGFNREGEVITVEPEYYEMGEDIPEDQDLAKRARQISRQVQ
jgi:2',3'-cyclic-nucleotide 2'-phosphodiesterase (5'-nucleotidase family)